MGKCRKRTKNMGMVRDSFGDLMGFNQLMEIEMGFI